MSMRAAGRRWIFGAFLLSLGTVMPASAQATADEQAVRAVVDRLFEAMAVHDTATMRTLFAPDARFAGVDREGNLSYTTPDEFFEGVGRGAGGPAFNETLYDVEIRIDGPLAQVWTYYTFHVDDRFSHCGYDGFQMLKLNGEWKIVHLADSRRREGCTHQEWRGSGS
jgi:uncharacterized protein (TIGR02246 family)